MRELTLGSLFDGSGGFPLAAALEGIRPVWASEVEPYPIAVTRSRFPNMKHYGDVSKINGAEIEPVDILSFGSPCQDLSVAGLRRGMRHEGKGDEETTRSGLFLEAIRIIREMREATHGVYPTYAIWENVTGAFSSSKGEDFRTVLNEFVNVVEPGAEVPPPPQGKWAYADVLVGDGWSIAYRVLDAQHWGVPQRRRRVYLVASFGNERAGEILFKRAGLRGHPAPRREAWEGTAADSEDGTGTADSESVRGVGINGDVAGTLDASYYKGCGMREGKEREVVVFDAYQHHGWRENTTTGPLTTANANSVRGGTPHAVAHPVKPTTDKAQGFGETGPGFWREGIQTLRAEGENRPSRPSNVIVNLNKDDFQSKQILAPNGSRPSHRGDGWSESDVSYTLNTVDCHAVAYGVDFRNGALNEEKYPTLQSKEKGGWSLNFSGGVLEDKMEQYKPQFDKELSAALVARGPNAVCYWDGGQTAGTLTASSANGAQRMPDKDNFNCVLEDKMEQRYIVRRLTPLECCRLQGFPDGWGETDAKEDFTDEEFAFWLDVRNTHGRINGKAVRHYTKAQMLTWYNKLHTDSAEYKMWGNGIALPCALYVMQGIVEAVKEEEHE